MNPLRAMTGQRLIYRLQKRTSLGVFYDILHAIRRKADIMIDARER